MDAVLFKKPSYLNTIVNNNINESNFAVLVLNQI